MNPPKLIEKLLHWALPSDLKGPILGDLAEEYCKRAKNTPFNAKYWYTRQALSTSVQFLGKTKRGLIMFLLGIIIFGGAILMGMIMSGELAMFINLPSLLIVLPPALIMTLASSTKQSRHHAVKLLFSDSLQLNKIELLAAKQAITTFGNMNMLMGWIGVVIGAISIATNISSDTFNQVFGSAFAVCVLTLFYALLIKALCYAAEAKIQFKIIHSAA